jgi:Ca2+:H+ antiporter
MKKSISFFRNKPINILLLMIPFALAASLFEWGEIWVFIFAALAIIPLAGYIGDATEALTVYTGPRIGGLLNATLGNAAELIITIVAIREGLLELVKASITGSILGNILLVMGMSFLLGGLRNGVQRFDPRHAGRNSILLLLAVIGLLIPSVLSASIGPASSVRVEVFSVGVAIILIILYIAALVYGFRITDTPLVTAAGQDLEKVRIAEEAKKTHSKEVHAGWSLRTTLVILAASTGSVVFISELLVGAVEPVVASLGISEFFLGVILIPIIGNVAEHLVAVKVAIENEMDLSVEIAIASSLQIALFVAPLLVFISLMMGNPLQLIFNEFELLALIAGVVIAALVSQDGESNWLEGAELLAVYIILALAFFLLPV